MNVVLNCLLYTPIYNTYMGGGGDAKAIPSSLARYHTKKIIRQANIPSLNRVITYKYALDHVCLNSSWKIRHGYLCP